MSQADFTILADNSFWLCVAHRIIIHIYYLFKLLSNLHLLKHLTIAIVIIWRIHDHWFVSTRPVEGVTRLKDMLVSWNALGLNLVRSLLNYNLTMTTLLLWRGRLIKRLVLNFKCILNACIATKALLNAFISLNCLAFSLISDLVATVHLIG